MSIGQELTSVRIDQLVQSMALGIAKAQYELDQTGLQLALLMSGTKEEERISLAGDANRYSLLELGFTPTFYQFVETTIELKIAISMSTSSESQTSTKSESSRSSAQGIFSRSTQTSCSTVNATYANKYAYSAEGSSLMRTRLVPVPAPTMLTERLRQLSEARDKPAQK